MNTDTCASLKNLEEVLATLLSPGGCPWDREQTPLSLADYVIEEAHELAAAIRDGKPQAVCGELGDVLFLLLFIARLYQQRGDFSLAGAMDECAAKMIRRHPHVFAGAKFSNREEQLKAWEAVKKEERGEKEGLFSGLPPSLPPLIKAYRIHSKAARIGFTWPDNEGVERQVEAEWLEWLDAVQEQNKDAQQHELGDMIFSLVELGRRYGIKASEALDFATRRFIRRFGRMEEMARANGRDLAQMPLDEQDELWSLAKEEESGHEDRD